MSKIFGIAVVLSVFLLPFGVFASVRINEIAWMGTSDSANNEWIELYNTGSEMVNLDGWTLEAVDGIPKINLSGIVQASGFFLLERTDDATVPSTSADLIYTGALSNSGEVLVLKNSSAGEIDKVDASSGWPAGDNTTKETMQFSGSGWVTAIATPRAANVGALAAAPNEPSSGAANSGETASPSSPSSQVGAAVSEPKIFAAITSGNQTAVVGAEIIFKGEAFGLQNKPLDNARYLWTFGDGAFREGRAVSHTYIYPSVYVVVLNITSGFDSARDSILVTVVPNQLEISEIMPGENSWIEIKNNSDYQIDISHWGIGANSNKFFFPEATFIRPQNYIIIPSEVYGFTIPAVSGGVELLYPKGQVANLFEYKGELKQGESFIKNGLSSAIGIATPGGLNQEARQATEEKKFVETSGGIAISEPKIPVKKEAIAVKDEILQETNSVKNDVSAKETVKNQIAASDISKPNGIKRWFFIALAVGIFGAAGFFLLRRLSSE